MIVRPRTPRWRLLFALQGSVLPAIAPQLGLAMAFAALVTLARDPLAGWKLTLTFVPFSLIGLTLAIFLGFRNSTSYARFWEARVLWGAVLNESRSLARLALTHGDDRAHAAVPIARLMAFVHALRHQLRGSDPRADLSRLLPAAEAQRVARARYRPALLLLMIGEWVGEMGRSGRLPPASVQTVEGPLGGLAQALGGCERIAGTPIPFAYVLILQRTTFLYCVLLPFGLVDSIGALTPLVVGFIAYTFFALEALCAELEDPFGLAANDLALDAMSRSIENSLREMLGEHPLPPEMLPVEAVLS